jgi:hypothetical protein
MLDYLTGTPQKLDVGFMPSPSGGGLHFWQEEEVRNCYLVVVGYTPDHSDLVPALITGVGYVQTVFGYPNEEAFWKDERGGLQNACYEIVGSNWADHVDDYNLRSFGTELDVKGTRALHHYFVGSKDASCQILATDLHVEVLPEMSFQAVVDESHRRVREETEATMARIYESIANSTAQQQARAEDQERRGHS